METPKITIVIEIGNATIATLRSIKNGYLEDSIVQDFLQDGEFIANLEITNETVTD